MLELPTVVHCAQLGARPHHACCMETRTSDYLYRPIAVCLEAPSPVLDLECFLLVSEGFQVEPSSAVDLYMEAVVA